jgi:hypothetical protein
LAASAKAGGCYQGQTHGHDGFLLPRDEAEALLSKHQRFSQVLWPFLIGEDMLSEVGGLPSRYVIDFHPRDMLSSKSFGELFERVEDEVLQDRKDAAEAEKQANVDALKENPETRLNWHHRNFLERWWLLSYPRADMIAAIRALPRYAVCVRVTKRPIFEFVSSAINPNDALMVFPYADDYSFGVLQSSAHWEWFVNRCSTHNARPRYTSNSVFDTFPWPQAPSKSDVLAVAESAANLRAVRRGLSQQHGLSYRDLYRTLEAPGKHPLRDAHASLDAAVASAYGMPKKAKLLQFLLAMNGTLAAAEERGEAIAGPGLPAQFAKLKGLVSSDMIAMP